MILYVGEGGIGERSVRLIHCISKLMPHHLGKCIEHSCLSTKPPHTLLSRLPRFSVLYLRPFMIRSQNSRRHSSTLTTWLPIPIMLLSLWDRVMTNSTATTTLSRKSRVKPVHHDTAGQVHNQQDSIGSTQGIDWSRTRANSTEHVDDFIQQYHEDNPYIPNSHDFHELDYPAIYNTLADKTLRCSHLSMDTQKLLGVTKCYSEDGQDPPKQLERLDELSLSLREDRKKYQDSINSCWKWLESVLPRSWQLCLPHNKVLSNFRQIQACVKLATSINELHPSISGSQKTVRSIRLLIDVINESGINLDEKQRADVLNARDVLTKHYENPTGLSYQDIERALNVARETCESVEEAFHELPVSSNVTTALYGQAKRVHDDLCQRSALDLTSTSQLLEIPQWHAEVGAGHSL